MSESKVKKDGASMASLMSAGFASVFTTSTLNGIDTGYTIFIGSFDIVNAFINFVISLLFFYPFSRFFSWLYSASPNKNP